MPGYLLPATASMSCTHGGEVLIVPTQARVLTLGGPATLSMDQLTVVGCAFTPPCTKVQWANLSARVTVNGQPVLLQAAPPPGPGNGLCAGAPPAPPVLKAMPLRVTAM
jgi:hypothetical protein